jgi:hypothetical protein
MRSQNMNRISGRVFLVIAPQKSDSNAISDHYVVRGVLLRDIRSLRST